MVIAVAVFNFNKWCHANHTDTKWDDKYPKENHKHNRDTSY